MSESEKVQSNLELLQDQLAKNQKLQTEAISAIIQRIFSSAAPEQKTKAKEMIALMNNNNSAATNKLVSVIEQYGSDDEKISIKKLTEDLENTKVVLTQEKSSEKSKDIILDPTTTSERLAEGVEEIQNSLNEAEPETSPESVFDDIFNSLSEENQELLMNLAQTTSDVTLDHTVRVRAADRYNNIIAENATPEQLAQLNAERVTEKLSKDEDTQEQKATLNTIPVRKVEVKDAKSKKRIELEENLLTKMEEYYNFLESTVLDILKDTNQPKSIKDALTMLIAKFKSDKNTDNTINKTKDLHDDYQKFISEHGSADMQHTLDILVTEITNLKEKISRLPSELVQDSQKPETPKTETAIKANNLLKYWPWGAGLLVVALAVFSGVTSNSGRSSSSEAATSQPAIEAVKINELAQTITAYRSLSDNGLKIENDKNTKNGINFTATRFVQVGNTTAEMLSTHQMNLYQGNMNYLQDILENIKRVNIDSLNLNLSPTLKSELQLEINNFDYTTKNDLIIIAAKVTGNNLSQKKLDTFEGKTVITLPESTIDGNNLTLTKENVEALAQIPLKIIEKNITSLPASLDSIKVPLLTALTKYIISEVIKNYSK
jgi:hypothetical protein